MSIHSLATLAGTAGYYCGTIDATGTSAKFNKLLRITIDGSNLYVADSSKHTIRRIIISSGVVTTLAGTAGYYGTTDATGTTARFKLPIGITTNGTNLYVTNYRNHTIARFSSLGFSSEHHLSKVFLNFLLHF